MSAINYANNIDISKPYQLNSKPQSSYSVFGSDGLGFGDIVDAINPLQQIPVISSIYRSVTGDKISAASRVIGGALTSGVIGAAGAAVNAAVEFATTEDISENILSFFTKSSENNDIFNNAKAVKLQADNGEAYVNVISNINLNNATERKSPENIKLRDNLNLQSNKSLGFDNAYKRTQFLANMNKIIVDMTG